MVSDVFELRPVSGPRVSDDAATFTEGFEAGFQRESGFYNMFQALQEQQHRPDPFFTLDKFFAKRPDLQPQWEYFKDAESELEANTLAQKLKMEQERQATMQQGWGGFTGSLAGAFASPSTFIPVIGAVGRLRTAASITATALGAATLDEVMLQNMQLTRTGDESFANIVGAGILGASLGGAVALMTRREMAAATGRIATGGREQFAPVVPPGLADGSLGAAAVNPTRDPGHLIGVLAEGESAGLMERFKDKVIRANAYMSPTTRNLTSEVPEVRAAQAQLADAGLGYRSNEVVAPGGTVEARSNYRTQNFIQRADTALQDAYAEYYHGKSVGFVGKQQALLAGLAPKTNSNRMSLAQFNEQVTIEMQKPQPGQVPQVVKAAQELRTMYDELSAEMVRVGLLDAKDIEGLPGGLNYLNRVYNKDEITARIQDFEDMIIRNYNQVYRQAFDTRTEKNTDIRAKTEEEIQLLSTDAETAAARLDAIEEERAALKEDEELTFELQAELSEAKSELRRLEKARKNRTNPATWSLTMDEAAALKERVKGLTEELERPLHKPVLEEDAKLRRQSRILSRSIGGLENRQAVIVEKLEKNFQTSIRAISKLSKKAAKFEKELATLSDEEYARGVAELQADFVNLAERLDDVEADNAKLLAEFPEMQTGPASFTMRVQRFRREVFKGGTLKVETEADRAEAIQRLADALDADTWTPAQRASLEQMRENIANARIVTEDQLAEAGAKLWAGEEKALGLQDKIAKTVDLLDSAADQGPDYARGVLRQFFEDSVAEVAARTEGQAIRRGKLRERYKAVDPDLARKRISSLEARLIQRDEDLEEWLRERGGTVNEDGSLDFNYGAKEYASELSQKIIGDPTRMPGLEQMAGKRGPELARVLDLPLEEVLPFTETDVSKLAHIYARTVVPDTELVRAGFGLRGEGLAPKIMKAYKKRIDALPNEVPEKVKAKGDEAAKAWIEKRNGELIAERNQRLRDFEGQIERIRHIRGVPANPDSMLYEAGRALASYNTTIMMGNVVMAQLVDPAIAVARFGLLKTFKHAFLPMIRGVKEFKMTKREALYYGMNELTYQSRLYQISDMFDARMGPKSKTGKAIDFLANKMGIIGLFSVWNQHAKTALTPMVAGELLDAVEVFMTGAGAMSQAKAMKALAKYRIDGDLAQRIWQQREAGGIVKNNGLWVPNTQSWTDADARTAFRTAVLAEMDSIIVTPGVERPLFVDMNMPAKLVTQFQSFMWSSHTKVVLAMLQEPDRKIAEAFLAASFLGAVSYYADMVARGRGDELENATPEDWADNILARSPFLGVLAGAQRVGEAVPAVRPYVTFSDDGADIKRWGRGPVEVLAGPSAGTLGNMQDVIRGIDDPTQSTANSLTRLTPFNNVTYLRQLFEAIAASSGLPEDRRD